MKYIVQMGIIMGICFLAEVLYVLLPLPIPTSIYGLLILFLLLMTKIVKLEQVEEVASFFLAIMPVLFLSPSVSIITSFDAVKGNVLSLLLAAAVSTVFTMVITGRVVQGIVQRKKKNKHAEEEKVEHE